MNPELEKEFRATVGANSYVFTTRGDSPVRRSIEEAQLNNETGNGDLTPRQEAETIAQIIALAPVRADIQTYQNTVKAILAISQLNDEEFAAHGYNRESVTITLVQSIQDYNDKKQTASRAPALGG